VTVDLARLRALAVATTVEAMYAADPDLEARFGVSGRAKCEADLQHHLDYLQAALDADDPAVFARYVGWLGDILEARGVPSRHLGASVALLERYFTAVLPPADAARVRAVVLAGPVSTAPQAEPSRGSAVLRYATAAFAGQQASLTALVEDAIALGGYAAAAIGLVQPGLYEVGRLWQQNRITVAQEHLATASSQRALSVAYLGATFAPPTGRTAVLASVQGNAHSLGLRMVADMFEIAGWEAMFLGANVPPADVVRMLDERRPTLLALSVCLPTQLVAARALIGEVRAELGQARPEVWIGGLATLGEGHAWRATGADGWARDPQHAVEQA